MPLRITVFCVGLFVAATHCVFLREYLSIFQGSIRAVGPILAVWFGAAGAGTLLGSRLSRWRGRLYLLGLAVCGLGGMVLIRASCLVFDRAAALSPLRLLLILIVTEAPAAFLGGLLFGLQSNRANGKIELYGDNQAGRTAGFLIAAAFIAGSAPNTLIVAAACLVLLKVFERKQIYGILLLILCGGFIIADGVTMRWKHAGPVERIQYTREGEVSLTPDSSGAVVLVNGMPAGKAPADTAVQAAVRQSLARYRAEHERRRLVDRDYRAWLIHWAATRPLSLGVIVLLFALGIAGAFAALPRTRTTLSLGSSGFAAGVAIVAYLMMYQAETGRLYADAAIVLAGLSGGLVVGSIVGRLPHGELVVGWYAALSLIFPALVNLPPMFLFGVLSVGLGALCGAQFSGEKHGPENTRHAVWLLFGAFGMALSSTILVPILGPAGTATVLVLPGTCAWGARYVLRRSD